MTNEYISLLQKGEFDQAEALRIKTIPQYLYKFYSLSSNGYGKKDVRTFRALREENIWLSSLCGYNDPFEGMGIYYDTPKFNEIGLLSSEIAAMEEKMSTYFGTSSFTTEINNIAMWAYYANDHQGFCVKYKILNKNIFHKVSYSKDRIPVFHALLKAIEETKAAETQAIDSGYYNRYHILLLQKYLMKHDSWKNEKEYRLISGELNGISGISSSFSEIGIKPVCIYAGLKCSNKNLNTLSNISKKLKCDELEIATINSSDSRFILFEGAYEREVLEKLKMLRKNSQ